MKGSKTKSVPPATPGCPGCAARDKRVAELEAAIARLEAKIAALEERLAQNSKNSHRPPSSDPPNVPPKPKPKSDRKRGGQLGHKGTNRKLFPAKDVDRFVDYRPSCCDRCGKTLPEDSGPEDLKPLRHQVIDLPEQPREVTEYRAHACMCEDCGHVTRATIPEEITRSSFGPRLVAAVGFLIGGCQLSRRQAQEALKDVFGIEISLGSIKNLEHEMSEALAEPVEEAVEVVRAAPAKNVDETGWKKSGWLWVAGTATLAFFAIGNRGNQGFRDLIGQKFLGVFTSDRWGIYNAVKNRFRQVCWSHLLRDFEKLIGRGGEPSRIGQEAKSIGADLFLVWKDFKAGEIDRETLKQCLRPSRKQLKDVLTRGARLTHTKSATFCENLLALEPALWTFLRVEGVEPTNNHAERLLRRGVLWRKKSFGSPSEKGRLFVTRILTAVQSRRIQGQPVYPFLIRAVTAHRTSQPAPSLVTT